MSDACCIMVVASGTVNVGAVVSPPFDTSTLPPLPRSLFRNTPSFILTTPYPWERGEESNLRLGQTKAAQIPLLQPRFKNDQYDGQRQQQPLQATRAPTLQRVMGEHQSSSEHPQNTSHKHIENNGKQNHKYRRQQEIHH